VEITYLEDTQSSTGNMFDADSHWNHLPTKVKPDLKDFLSTLFRSKANSTVKKYKKEILKFIEWCNLSNVRPVPPFPVSLAVVYLHKVYKSSNSYAALVVAHAAFKWFHSFIPDNGRNPLDSSIFVITCWKLLSVVNQLLLRRLLSLLT